MRGSVVLPLVPCNQRGSLVSARMPSPSSSPAQETLWLCFTHDSTFRDLMLAHTTFLCSGSLPTKNCRNLCSNLRCVFHIFLNSFSHGMSSSLFSSPSPQLTIHWLNRGFEGGTRNISTGRKRSPRSGRCESTEGLSRRVPHGPAHPFPRSSLHPQFTQCL